MLEFSKKHRFLFSALVLFMGLVWIGITSSTSDGSSALLSVPQVGFKAPDFTLGDQLALRRGRVELGPLITIGQRQMRVEGQCQKQ